MKHILFLVVLAFCLGALNGCVDNDNSRREDTVLLYFEALSAGNTAVLDSLAAPFGGVGILPVRRNSSRMPESWKERTAWGFYDELGKQDVGEIARIDAGGLPRLLGQAFDGVNVERLNVVSSVDSTVEYSVDVVFASGEALSGLGFEVVALASGDFVRRIDNRIFISRLPQEFDENQLYNLYLEDNETVVKTHKDKESETEIIEEYFLDSGELHGRYEKRKYSIESIPTAGRTFHRTIYKERVVGSYKNGMRNGEWTWRDRHGEVDKVCQYRDDVAECYRRGRRYDETILSNDGKRLEVFYNDNGDTLRSRCVTHVELEMSSTIVWDEEFEYIGGQLVSKIRSESRGDRYRVVEVTWWDLSGLLRRKRSITQYECKPQENAEEVLFLYKGDLQRMRSHSPSDFVKMYYVESWYYPDGNLLSQGVVAIVGGKQPDMRVGEWRFWGMSGALLVSGEIGSWSFNHDPPYRYYREVPVGRWTVFGQDGNAVLSTMLAVEAELSGQWRPSNDSDFLIGIGRDCSVQWGQLVSAVGVPGQEVWDAGRWTRLCGSE